MRAVICRAWGEVDTLSVEDVPPPMPAADEVLIDVRATGVNYADAIMVAGRYPDAARRFRSARVSKPAGVVAACGDGVTRFRPGDG